MARASLMNPAKTKKATKAKKTKANFTYLPDRAEKKRATKKKK